MKVFYTPKMVADSGGYSPSAAKPKLAVESWLAAGLPVELVWPVPVSIDQLSRAHDRCYVEDVLNGDESNGFGNYSQEVTDSLPYTSGAMLAAARHAVETGENCCAPVSGFHHAGYDFGGGYCTFNGLMVAAMDLLESGAAQKVGILDFDQHYGNGTDSIIASLGVGASVAHYSAGRHYLDADDFIQSIPSLVHSLFFDCDVLLYQAGADPHIDDPLGGWLTTEQLFMRDTLVFHTAGQLGLPVAWNLAGGYQRDADGGISKVLAIHENTFRACLAAN